MAIVLSTSDNAKLEPKRKCRWIVSFDSIPGDTTTRAAEKLSLACYKGTKPQVTFGVTELNRINEKWKFAGRPGWNELNFEFYDFIITNGTNSAFTIFKNWWTKIYNPLTGQAGYAIEYKTHGTVAMLDPKGVVVQTWHVFYMWPKEVTGGDLDYSSEEVSSISTNFVYDYAIPGEEIAGGTSGPNHNGETYPVF